MFVYEVGSDSYGELPSELFPLEAGQRVPLPVRPDEDVELVLTGKMGNEIKDASGSTVTQPGPLSLVESSRVMLAPAVLCHKEPARRIQSPLLGALERKKTQRVFLLAPRWFFMA